MKEEKIQIDGVVKTALPNATFKVEIEGGHLVTAQISGKIRTHFIRIMPGDLVTVEVSTYDVHRGRIIYRKGRARNETNQ